MQSSNTAPPSSLFICPAAIPSLLRRRTVSFLRSNNANNLHLSASFSDSHLLLSWLPPSPASDDGCSGWSYSPAAPPLTVEKKGLPVVLIGGVSVAALLAAIGYFTVSGRGFRLQFRSTWRVFDGAVSSVGTNVVDDSIRNYENVRVLEGVTETASGDTLTTVPREKSTSFEVSIPVDSSQLEALSILKKLKIIEDDVRVNELCTRREYARWLVRLNSLLERNPKHRIVPSVSLSGSVIAAFDDVGVEDPDFESIQALAEAGIVPSKLSGANSEGDGIFYFYPERFIARQDLIDWKAQLEHGSSSKEITEQMSKAKIDYMDVKEISSHASPELFIDMLAGDGSIIRKVFGRSIRFQPHKPSTKAQAAVALTSGRMTAAIHNEISRLEAENTSRQAAMEEIMSELLDRGEIQKFWDHKMEEERIHGAAVEKLYIATLHDLEEEKTSRVKDAAEAVKEKAAMVFQKQLLHSLKEEVDEMSEKLASEKTMYMAEQRNLQKMFGELHINQEELVDKRSILEAEIEAIRILRSWVEDEARKSQARAKVLEEVARRWKWDNESGIN